MRNIRETFCWERALLLTRFPNGGWRIWGEEEQYYIKEHHEPIVSPEIWDAAQEIKKAATVKAQCQLMGQVKSTAGNLPSAVCVNVDSAENI